MNHSPQLITHSSQALPPLIDTPCALQDACVLLESGSGSIGIDTERAGSFRYFQGAYLVQIYREGTGILLIDPQALPDLSPVNRAIGRSEWVLHSATQDLPSLAGLGLHPQLLFDTEIAAQLLNFGSFGLVAILEKLLDISLAKTHSAADWSTRPLPLDWMQYAALDVEFLPRLRHRLWDLLSDCGKDDWAEQEFDFLLDYRAPAARPDPWRHIPGSGKVQTPRGLAAMKELWEARDRIAAQENLAPSKVLTNAALVALAQNLPRGRRYMISIPEFRHDKNGMARADVWYAAVSRAAKLPASKLPNRRAPRVPGGVPEARNLAHNHPQEAERWHRLRDAVGEIASQLDVWSDTMLEPKTIRRLAWVLPDNASREQILQVLQASKARSWQIENTIEALHAALRID